MGHFSPRALAAAMSRMVRRRVAWPPYSGSGIPAGVVGVAVAGAPVAVVAVAVVAGASWPWSAVIASSASRCALVASPDHLMIARPAGSRPVLIPGTDELWAADGGWLQWPHLRYDHVSYRFLRATTQNALDLDRASRRQVWTARQFSGAAGSFSAS